MHKKLMLACMAIAAFGAFVIAPVASASPVLTHEGKPVPVGTKIFGTLTGNATFTASVEVTCDHVILTGEVTKNSGTAIEGKITTKDFNGTASSTECTSTLFGAPVLVTVNSNLCVKSTVLGVATTDGCGGAVVFTLNLTGNGPCKYSTASVTGTYKANEPPVTISEQESKLVEGGFFCPGSGKLDMTFDLWTDVEGKEVGNPLVVS